MKLPCTLGFETATLTRAITRKSKSSASVRDVIGGLDILARVVVPRCRQPSWSNLQASFGKAWTPNDAQEWDFRISRDDEVSKPKFPDTMKFEISWLGERTARYKKVS